MSQSSNNYSDSNLRIEGNPEIYHEQSENQEYNQYSERNNTRRYQNRINDDGGDPEIYHEQSEKQEYELYSEGNSERNNNENRINDDEDNINKLDKEIFYEEQHEEPYKEQSEQNNESHDSYLPGNYRGINYYENINGRENNNINHLSSVNSQGIKMPEIIDLVDLDEEEKKEAKKRRNKQINEELEKKISEKRYRIEFFKDPEQGGVPKEQQFNMFYMNLMAKIKRDEIAMGKIYDSITQKLKERNLNFEDAFIEITLEDCFLEKEDNMVTIGNIMDICRFLFGKGVKKIQITDLVCGGAIHKIQTSLNCKKLLEELKNKDLKIYLGYGCKQDFGLDRANWIDIITKNEEKEFAYQLYNIDKDREKTITEKPNYGQMNQFYEDILGKTYEQIIEEEQKENEKEDKKEEENSNNLFPEQNIKENSNNFFTKPWKDSTKKEKVKFVLTQIGLGLITGGIFNLVYLIIKVVKNGCACLSKDSVNTLENGMGRAGNNENLNLNFGGRRH